MTRRPRSFLGLSRGGTLRAPLIGLALAIGLTAAACSSDLFHDTQWQSRCDLDPDAVICPQGTGGASSTTGMSTTSSASSSDSSSASTTSGAGGGSSASTTGAATAASSSTG